MFLPFCLLVSAVLHGSLPEAPAFLRRGPAFCEMRFYSFRSFPVFLTDNLYIVN